MKSELRDKIGLWESVLMTDIYQPLMPLSWEVLRSSEQVPFQELSEHTFVPVTPGYTWGNSFEYAWFHTTVVLGKEAAGREIAVDLCAGAEATVFVNGEAFGTYRADWIKYPHHYYIDNILTREAKPGDTFDIYMEVFAGCDYPGKSSPGCMTGPMIPGAYKPAGTEGARVTLGEGTVGFIDEDAYQLYLDVEVLYSLYKVEDPDSLRASKLEDALEDFVTCTEFERPRDVRDESYRSVREKIRPALKAQNGTTAPDFCAIGNAHLDLAWLWTMRETWRKTARTFAAQLRLLDEYPEYLFLQSTPASYEMCREHYPKLFDRIVKAVKSGRFLAEGAMWVEPDTNMSGGESLVRQILYGRKYYKEVFGVDSVLLWLPDTFGYSGALPQILKKSGVKYLVTQKIFWSYNEGEPFPYHYFNWKGIDGSSVEAFLPTRYEYYPLPEEMMKVWKNRTQKRHLDAFLMPYGYGDGGGGPTRDHIELIRRQNNLEGDVRMHNESPVSFFERMDAAGGPVNTYSGELYFTAHRGTYTGQAMIKKLNRKLEEDLFSLEMAGVMADVAHGTGNPGKEDAVPQEERRSVPVCLRKEEERLWKVLLLHQFHDILPGSAITRVYEDARAKMREADEEVLRLRDAVFEDLTTDSGDAFTVWNLLSFARDCYVKVPENWKGTLQDESGAVVPVYEEEEGCTALVRVPAMSGRTIRRAAEEPALRDKESALPQAHARCADGAIVLENGHLRVVFNRNGEITSFRLKKEKPDIRGKEVYGPEFVRERMNVFRLYRDIPRKFDAWDIDSDYISQELPCLEGACLKIVKEGGSAAELELTGTIGDSSLHQSILLRADSGRVEFRTDIDWKETHRLLKVEASTNILTSAGMNEIQFGYIERPADRSRVYEQERFEVCNHRWSALREEGRGFAVLNDCKYGISMNDGKLALSLLTASTCPDVTADRHVHHFTYAYTAYEGAFADSDIVRQGYELCTQPLVTGPARENPGGRSLFSIEENNIFVSSVKTAEDDSGDIILRMYEAMKKETVCRVNCGFPVYSASLCDLMEQNETKLETEENGFTVLFRPFEINTVRIRRKR